MTTGSGNSAGETYCGPGHSLLPLRAHRLSGLQFRSGNGPGWQPGRAPGQHVTAVPARQGSQPGHRVHFMVRARRSVLLLAADEFEDMELLYPLYRLREEDVAVTVAGLDDQPVTGKKGHGPVPVDCPAGQVAADDFDALVIPGGYAPDKLRRSEAVLGLVRAFDD